MANNKKGQKKKGGAVGGTVLSVVNVAGFSSTKKNFPNLKVQNHKKNYVSPYSIKVMQK